MPRRNRPKRQPQHPRAGKQNGRRPRGWRHSHGSANVQKAVRWLTKEGL